MGVLHVHVKLAVMSGGILLSKPCFSQLNKIPSQKIETLQKSEHTYYLFFIYTDWCNYCHAMRETTFKNPNVIEKLSHDFYYQPLNAEEKQSITILGKTFHYKPNGKNTGIHELAEELGSIDGKLSYPTLVILNSTMEIIFQYNGFMGHQQLLDVLNQL